MAELRVWTDCAIARYRAKFWLYFMRAMIFLIFHSFGFVPKALDSQAQGLKVPASYFMRAVIFLIFDSFDSVPKALDSQAQGLKVPASHRCHFQG